MRTLAKKGMLVRHVSMDSSKHLLLYRSLLRLDMLESRCNSSLHHGSFAADKYCSKKMLLQREGRATPCANLG